MNDDYHDGQTRRPVKAPERPVRPPPFRPRSALYAPADLDRAFNRFSEFALLGEGGFGSVFSVWDQVRNQYVALKLTRDNGDAAWRARFVQEYDILRVVHSPRLVSVYDSSVNSICMADGSVAEHLWYSMERCASSVESQWSKLDVKARAQLCVEVIEGLAVLHEKGIAHRDIKPKNLFLREGGLKIGDFGIAKDLSSRHGEETPMGKCIGTFEFLAPERWRGTEGKELDWRPSDQYAASVSIYQILSRGSDPLDFGDRNVMKCLNAHVKGTVIPLKIPDVPGAFREVDRVLGRMLAKEPGGRFSSMARCQRELESAFKQHSLL